MIPVNEPALGERELEYVTDCVQTGWVSSAGTYLDRFEEAWALHCGAQFGVAVSSGTGALQAAVASLGIEPGDEIILPSFTIISCVQAILAAGGQPVLVDCDPETWCMDVGRVAARINDRTRALMPVHIYGHPVDMDPLRVLAERHGLAIIEDAAEAHGAEYLSGHATGSGTWRRCGGLGDLSAFSFYANKLVTTGEGGMVLTNDPDRAAFLRRYRNLGFAPPRRFEHRELGANLRMTNMQAALGLAQVERIEGIVARKRWMGRAYSERLADIPGLRLPVERPWARSVYWMYGVVLERQPPMQAEDLARSLIERGVQSRPFFLGMHEQPVLKERGFFSQESYPVTERIARAGLYLPSGLTLTESQIDEVCEAVRDSLL
jgi:perosamine synthetase